MNVKEPLVSIITPVYNAEKYIRICIESVLAQTYQNWEFILVDDFSTDYSLSIIKEYIKIDNRIRLIQNSCNLGAAISRNVGLDIARGDYIAFIDSDDEWEKDKLFLQITKMLNEKMYMSYTSYNLINENGILLKYIDVDEKLDYSSLLKGNQIKTSTLIIDSTIVSTIRFPKIAHEDYAFFLDLLRKVGVAYKCGEATCKYRVSNSSLSSNKSISALWTWRIYRDYEKLSFFKSLYYFVHYAYNGFMKYKRD
ncbi:glycosyltransferase family 2 protein [Mannheimia varigena]|uniref:glycosyltransferase family 2 protein n=1 Tax=Mannheimia varigena TaxID=85404 RepID=UPI00046D7E02|nr:glycosyltransferase family 2 protein [Mannheimia varigena]